MILLYKLRSRLSAQPRQNHRCVFFITTATATRRSFKCSYAPTRSARAWVTRYTTESA